MERRLKVRAGDLPKDDQKIRVDSGDEHSFNCVTQLDLLTMENALPYLKYPPAGDNMPSKAQA